MITGKSMPTLKFNIPTVDLSRLIQSLSLRSRAPGALTVGSTQLKPQAVQTSHIAYGAVTPARSSPIMRKHMWLGDETGVQGTPGSYTTRKDWTAIRSGTAAIPYGSMILLYELRRPPGSAGSVRMRVTLGGSPGFISPYINSGTWGLRQGSMRIGQLAQGSRIPVAMQLRSSVTTATAYQRLIEIYGQIETAD